MVFHLLKLEQYLKSYELFQFKSFSVFTVRAGPQVGPGRFQAGMEAEEAGLRAGPNRGAGRGQARGNRPHGRPRPGVRPGQRQRLPASRPVQAGRQAGRTVSDDADGGERPALTKRGGAP